MPPWSAKKNSHSKCLVVFKNINPNDYEKENDI